MKNILTFLLILSFLICSSQESIRENLTIVEDENIQITLSYLKEADLSYSNWLKLILKNKSNEAIIIKSASYSINKEKVEKNGNNYINRGVYGSSNKHDLIHQFYDFENYLHYRDTVQIEAQSSIEAWKYLTNYASVLIDGRELEDNNIVALFELKFEYEFQGNTYELKSDNIPFSFLWTNSDNISSRHLVERLKNIIHNPHYRWVNSYVTSNLMQIEEVRKSISSNDLIQGILLRDNVMNAGENILFLSELKNRNEIPNKSLTQSFIKRLKGKMSNVTTEIQYYWDDELLEPILKTEYSHRLYNMLEINSDYWSIDPNNNNKIYDYLVESSNFSFPEKMDQENLKQWSADIKMIAIARHPKFEKYLRGFLNNQTEFEIEDWSKYRGYGMLPKGAKPDVIKIRLCDVALVALLRNMDQIKFKLSSSIGTKSYTMTIKEELLDKAIIDKFGQFNLINDIRLGLYEKEIKLNPTLYEKINQKVAAGNKR